MTDVRHGDDMRLLLGLPPPGEAGEAGEGRGPPSLPRLTDSFLAPAPAPWVGQLQVRVTGSDRAGTGGGGIEPISRNFGRTCLGSNIVEGRRNEKGRERKGGRERERGPCRTAVSALGSVGRSMA